MSIELEYFRKWVHKENHAMPAVCARRNIYYLYFETVSRVNKFHRNEVF